LIVVNSLLSGVLSFCPFSQRSVVNQTHAIQRPAQDVFLPFGWVKAILEGTFGHASHFNKLFVTINGGGISSHLLGVAGVSTPKLDEKSFSKIN
jgi:hypothetical protein